MEIHGYKCFNKNLTNAYGKKFEVGKEYTTIGNLKFGDEGNGFHLAKNIEDTFKFFDTSQKDICVCEVIGSGKILKNDDEFYEYFDLYCVKNLKIVKQLTREELIRLGLMLNPESAKRYVSTLSLTTEEKELFKISPKLASKFIK